MMAVTPVVRMHFVPYQIPCPCCEKAGLVRVETLVKAATTSRGLCCGGCEHQGVIADAPEAAVPPRPSLPRPRTRSYDPRQRG